MTTESDAPNPSPKRLNDGLTVLVTSPRVAPGILSRSAWETLATTDLVLASSLEDPVVAALVEQGVTIHAESVTADDLLAQAAEQPICWVCSSTGDPELLDALGAAASALDDPPSLEILVGSWDVPGARLLDVVAVMDRLRSPGGCPWDAEQTHESLLRYLAEESSEYADAVRSGSREDMAEELGDVLLQVAFHARVAQEHPTEPFDIDEVAAILVDKLVRRHPHVFADVEVSGAEEVAANWEQIKAQERADKAARSR